MKNKIERILFIMLSIVIILLLSMGLVSAHEHDFTETKQLIDSGISCDKLTDEQLESMGDYYMEQMHPGEAHEIMDNMMGGEGSQDLKQMHVQMARSLYCKENSGMMSGMMMPMMGKGMMNGGMMGNIMGNQNGLTWTFDNSYWYGSIWNIIWFVFWLGVLLLAVWIIYRFITKSNSEDHFAILKQRLAKGEITRKEYEEIKKGLGE